MSHKHKKEHIRECRFNACERRADLQCRYCQEFFCREHRDAKIPGMPNFTSDLPYDRHLMKEWRKPGGHPCPDYYDYVEKKREFEGKKYAIALDRLIKSPPFERKPIYEPVNEEEEPTKFEPITEEDKKGTNAPPKNIYKKPKPFYPHKDNDKKIHRKFNFKSLLIKSAIILAIILIIFIGVFLAISYQPNNIIYFNETRIVDKNVTDRVSLNVSISQYSIINDPDHSSNISVLGYLKEEYTIINSESSSITKYISDDYDNKIKLSLGLSASFSAGPYFVKNSTTNQTYRIIGILKNTNNGLRIDVNSITLEEHPYKEVNRIESKEEIVTINNTVPGKMNLSFGLNRISFIFGCTDDERRYNFGCIKIVECSDGTLEPECSDTKPFQCIGGSLVENSTICGCDKNATIDKDGCRSILCTDGTIEPKCSTTKPYQCINNTLIKNSTKCGCPEDYKVKNNDCVKIQRCDDRTIYDECSITKPLYCEEGDLINKASKCGCSWGDYPDGELCITKERAVEKQIFYYTNEERNSEGKKSLTWDDKLSNIAREHSTDMGENDFFAHENLDGEDPTDRARRAKYPLYKNLGGGYYSEGIAENIGMMPTGNVEGMGYISDTPESVGRAQVDSWMDSTGHRENILDDGYDKIGVGCYYDGQYYICTQNFW
jgi:uncharacterized protein YkwD